MQPPVLEVQCYYCRIDLYHWLAIEAMKLADGFEISERHIYRCGCLERNHTLVLKGDYWEWRNPPGVTESRIPCL